MAEGDKEKGYAVKQEDQVNIPFRSKTPFLSHLRGEGASAKEENALTTEKLRIIQDRNKDCEFGWEVEICS